MQQKRNVQGKHAKPNADRGRKAKPKTPKMKRTDLKFEAVDENGRTTMRKVYEDERGRKFIRVLTKYIPVGQYARKFARSQFVSD